MRLHLSPANDGNAPLPPSRFYSVATQLAARAPFACFTNTLERPSDTSRRAAWCPPATVAREWRRALVRREPPLRPPLPLAQGPLFRCCPQTTGQPALGHLLSLRLYSHKRLHIERGHRPGTNYDSLRTSFQLHTLWSTCGLGRTSQH